MDSDHEMKMSDTLLQEIIDYPFEGFKKKDATRALQTFFRSSFRTHVGLIGIADRKANIMLRLNSLLLSGALIFYENILDYSKLSMITLVFFLITTLASLVTAALATRPFAAINSNEKSLLPEEAARHTFFFAHYAKMKLEDYEKAVAIMANNTGMIYGNMARDLHLFGQMLERKYRMLRLSYNVFIFGMLTTLISFFAILWLKA